MGQAGWRRFWVALSGLDFLLDPVPRAMPWAVMGRAFGPWMLEDASKVANCDLKESSFVFKVTDCDLKERGAFFEVTICDFKMEGVRFDIANCDIKECGSWFEVAFCDLKFSCG
jgi:hypothetical protein